MKKLLTIIIFLMHFTSAVGQHTQWTLEECIAWGVEHSFRRINQENRNRIYQEDYREALGSLLPTVNTATNAYFNFGRALSEDNTYINSNSFTNNYEIHSSVVVFDGLASINKLRMQKITRLMGAHRLQKEADDIAFDIMEAFLAVQYYEQLTDLALEQAAQSAADLRQMERMVELGMRSHPDLAEKRAKEAEDRYNLTRQRNLALTAYIRLKEAMNYPTEETFSIEHYSCAEPIVGTADRPLDIYENSLEILPAVLAADVELKTWEYAYKTARGRSWPTIGVVAGVSTNFFRHLGTSRFASFGSQFENKLGQYVGFTMSVPVFNGLSRRSEIRRSSYEYRIARNTYDESLRTLYAEIEQAVADMNGQAEEYHLAVRQREAIQAAHAANERKYAEGLISAIELHTSTNRLLQARIEEANSEMKYYLKNRLVRYYKGEPLAVVKR